MQSCQLKKVQCMFSNVINEHGMLFGEHITIYYYRVQDSKRDVVCYPRWLLILKVFSCPAYAHLEEGKLEHRLKRCIFLGYASGVKRRRFSDTLIQGLWWLHLISPKEKSLLSQLIQEDTTWVEDETRSGALHLGDFHEETSRQQQKTHKQCNIVRPC